MATLKFARPSAQVGPASSFASLIVEAAAMDSPNGDQVRRCFRILIAKIIGLMIALADITAKEFRLIEAERQEKGKTSNVQ